MLCLSRCRRCLLVSSRFKCCQLWRRRCSFCRSKTTEKTTNRRSQAQIVKYNDIDAIKSGSEKSCTLKVRHLSTSFSEIGAQSYHGIFNEELGWRHICQCCCDRAFGGFWQQCININFKFINLIS